MRKPVATVFALLLGALFVPSIASAQTELASQQARVAQYVFVVDDSGSMRIKDKGLPPADPDRLAVFAVRSTLSMLDDSDEATVAQLNAPDAIPNIAPLASNRSALVNMLRLSGEMASYRGKNTYCKRALDAVKEELNDSHRPGVSQVVMFLTDGRCEDSPSVSQFLSGLRSHNEGLFSFYLIRFEGRQYSEVLADLAERTDGDSIEATAEDPATLLYPFAKALSRSQGYEAYLLDRRNGRLAAHRGARRVRLLAVAPGTGPKLEFQINPVAKGEKPARIGATRAGTHQYQDGRTFRYASLDYRPGTVPVEVTAKNGGSNWKIVAVPEYRLFTELTMYQGNCAAKGPRVLHVEVGQSVCARVRLVNEKGELVPADIAGIGSGAEVSYWKPGSKQHTNLNADRDGNEASWMFERVKLDKGDHGFKPRVAVAVPGRKGEKVVIAGARKTLQVTSTNVRVTPSKVKVGTLVPGQRKFQKIRIDGNFSPAKGTLRAPDRSGVPKCVHFELSGKAEGESQTITPGQEYQVSVKVDPFCGPVSIKRALEQNVMIEFAGAGQIIPSLPIPVEMVLDSKFGMPKELAVEMDAGDSRDITVEFKGNYSRPLEIAALVEAHDDREDWPADEDDLLLGFVDENDDLVMRDGEPALVNKAVYEPGNKNSKPVVVRVDSDACCKAGTYISKVLFKPAGGADPVALPLKVTVRPVSVWACWGPMILWSLAALLLLLLVLYIFNIFRKSHFLKKKKLLREIQPLEWLGSTPQASRSLKRESDIQLKRDLKFGKRVGAWLGANPLRVGLPGQRPYQEAIELVLAKPQKAYFRIMSARELERLEKDAEPNPILLICARPRHKIIVVPDNEGEVRKLQPSPSYLEPKALNKPRSLELEADSSGDGEYAGWKIGR